MLQSYFEEIRKKRNAARLFWAIVFLFAATLYFFFQGYYPAIHLERFFSASGGSFMESGSLIRSFGIVNINIKTPTATSFLNGSVYTNGDKKMVDYGNYMININKPGYVSGEMSFVINKETPYYIDDVTLLPTGTYTPLDKNLSNIASLGNDTWLTQSGRTTWLYSGGFDTGSLVLTGTVDHIGEGHFLSGTSIMEYNTKEGLWKIKNSTPLTKYLQKCASPKYQNGYLFCEKNHTLFTEKGKTLTGILSIGDGYIEKSGSLLLDNPDDLNPKVLSLSGTNIIDHRFIKIEGIWYTPSESGSLISIGENPTKEIDTGLSNIEYITWENGFLISVGKYEGKSYLTLYDLRIPQNIKKIPLSDRPLRDIRISSIGGNFFLKTSDSLLFFYKGSDHIEWLVDGEILAVGKDFALYKKDGKIWKGSWMDQNIKN